MKYCDDADCPNFENGCKLGFKIRLRVPKSMAEAATHDWGYVMPKICRIKFKKAKVKDSRSVD